MTITICGALEYQIRTFLFCIVLLAFFGSIGSLDASESSYLKETGTKFARGLTNMATSPLEYPAMVERGLEDDDPVRFILAGPFRGTASFLRRFSAGAYEVATFLIPQKPVLKPIEYLPGIMEYRKQKLSARGNLP